MILWGRHRETWSVAERTDKDMRENRNHIHSHTNEAIRNTGTENRKHKDHKTLNYDRLNSCFLISEVQ